MNFTYQTARCPRMYPDTPFVGCTCIDCRAIRLWRRASLAVKRIRCRFDGHGGIYSNGENWVCKKCGAAVSVNPWK